MYVRVYLKTEMKNLSEKLENRIGKAFLSAIPEPFFIFDENGVYVKVFGGADMEKYHDGTHLTGRQIHEVMDSELADLYLSQIQKAIRSEKVLNYVYQLSAKDIKGSETLPGPEGPQWFEAHISPLEKMEGLPRMVIWIAFNITESVETLKEKEALILDLKKANKEIKSLRGILPICARCKKIRDDEGYWKQIEGYIQKHSQASFSHGLCPRCSDELYEGQAWYARMKEKKAKAGPGIQDPS